MGKRGECQRTALSQQPPWDPEPCTGCGCHHLICPDAACVQLYAGLSNLGLSMFFGLLTAFGLKVRGWPGIQLLQRLLQGTAAMLTVILTHALQTLGQSVAIALVLLFIAVQVLSAGCLHSLRNLQLGSDGSKRACCSYVRLAASGHAACLAAAGQGHRPLTYTMQRCIPASISVLVGCHLAPASSPR
jgi:hypothetical protein